jgi:hypothetical protein
MIGQIVVNVLFDVNNIFIFLVTLRTMRVLDAKISLAIFVIQCYIFLGGENYEIRNDAVEYQGSETNPDQDQK